MGISKVTRSKAKVRSSGGPKDVFGVVRPQVVNRFEQQQQQRNQQFLQPQLQDQQLQQQQQQQLQLQQQQQQLQWQQQQQYAQQRQEFEQQQQQLLQNLYSFRGAYAGQQQQLQPQQLQPQQLQQQQQVQQQLQQYPFPQTQSRPLAGGFAEQPNYYTTQQHMGFLQQQQQQVEREQQQQVAQQYGNGQFAMTTSQSIGMPIPESSVAPSTSYQPSSAVSHVSFTSGNLKYNF